MAQHWIKAELDGATGKIEVRHFAAAPFGPAEAKRDATVFVDVEIPAELADKFRALLLQAAEINRAKLETLVRKAAALHNHIAEQRGEFDVKT
jgi:CRP-like cAMP-binding protein